MTGQNNPPGEHIAEMRPENAPIPCLGPFPHPPASVALRAGISAHRGGRAPDRRATHAADRAVDEGIARAEALGRGAGVLRAP